MAAVMMDQNLLHRLAAMGNTLRIDALLATTAAGSGHPTSCMSAADLVAAVFFYAMRFDLTNPKNPLNDRFVLSKGHAAPLLYAAWAEAGAFPRERLNTLRQFGSALEGHPTPRLPWVDVATGSLGQGLSNGLGMALNAKYLDRSGARVFVLMGDGEAAEGSVWEAAELAAYYKLDNLVGLLDVNGLGQSQWTMYGHDTDPYRRRFEACGWHAIVLDGHDLGQIAHALDEAARTPGRPTMLVAATRKGHGATLTADQEHWHGKALKAGPELEQALAELRAHNLDTQGLHVASPQGRTLNPVAHEQQAPVPAAPTYTPGQQVATREAYGTALAALGHSNTLVAALDGDTKNSTFAEKFAQAHPQRYFEAFIAEQNMVGAAVGLAALGKIPFASTFAAFLARAYDQLRMAAISRANIKLCGSHAGVSIGEDGPSQMGLEDLAMFRALHGAAVLYPADAVATQHAVRLAAEHPGMVYIRTSRPKTPVLYAADEQFALGQAKVVRQSSDDRLTLVAGGVTLFEALNAHAQLQSVGIAVRVIDIFSVQPIDAQLLRSAGQETNNLIVTVEDHAPAGGIGEAVAGAVAPFGIRVHTLAVRELPRSGTGAELLAAYGIDAVAIVKTVKALLSGD